MLVKGKICKVFAIEYVYEDTNRDNAEKAIIQAICEASNAIVGDDIDGKETKITKVES